MLNKVQTATAQGRYFWELIFSYDNRDNEASTIKRTVRKERVTEVNSRVFLSEKFSVSSGFKYKNQTNASLDFKGIGANNTSEFSFHIETAMQLEETSETTTNVKESEYFEEVVEVEAGDAIAGYRLCYVTNGVFVATDVISLVPVDSDPPADIIVDLEFSVKERILGFRTVVEQLRKTRPGQDNKREWRDIRETIIRSSSMSQEDAFRELVEQLAKTEPSRDNKAEWAQIRTTCNEILRDWETINIQLLFHKLLSRFATTYPGRDNKKEWSEIRRVSNSVLNEVTTFT